MILLEFDKYIELLKVASEAYYNSGETIMTDKEYDDLYHKCLSFAKDNNIKNDFLKHQVGFVINGKNVIKHKTKMYSQKDIFDVEEAITWCSKKISKAFYLEPKLDGCSCNLYYNNGKLVSAATRGDGLIGQDITNIIDVINFVPLTIDYKEPIEIRGELLMSFKNFERYKNTFKNPRNLVAGTLNMLDKDDIKERSIDFIPWGLGFNKLKMNKSEIKPFLTKLGFKAIFDTLIISELSGINKHYKYFIKNRNKLKYPIDGMMIYINKHSDQMFYDYAEKFPLFSIALKLPALEVSTTLNGVEYNIGRNGMLSIVGLLDPVDLLGTTVKKATLHNMNYIKSKDIRLNDKVVVYKAGDIVPAIKESFTTIRTGNEKEIKISKCPFCKHPLEDNKGMLKCINIDCKGILKSKLKYAVSKKCLHIEGIGDEFINKVVDILDLKHVVDFFTMDAHSLEKYYIKLHPKRDNEYIAWLKIQDIDKYLNKPYSLRLEALSIPGLGKAKCIHLENNGVVNYKTLIKYLNSSNNSINKALLEEIEKDIKIKKYLGAKL